MTANDHLAHLIPRIQADKLLGHIDHLHCRDPNRFSAGCITIALNYSILASSMTKSLDGYDIRCIFFVIFNTSLPH